MVFQSYAIFPHLTVAENVAFGLELRGLRKAEIARRWTPSWTWSNWPGLEHRSPEQLSGGQQQRVALARAIITEPKVLLFDEPLSNLDAKLREQMRGEIRRHPADGSASPASTSPTTRPRPWPCPTGSW